jgi:hypothetical protein
MSPSLLTKALLVNFMSCSRIRLDEIEVLFEDFRAFREVFGCEGLILNSL